MGVEAQSQLRQDDNGLHYSLNMRQDEWNKTGLDKNDFCQFLTFLLHDVRYIRIFNMPIANKVKSRMEEKEGMVCFEYEIIID